MSNSEFDLDEALDTVAEARERKQKRRDALIEFAVSQGMVGSDYDGKHGEAGSRDQDAPYPELLQEEFGAETPHEHYEKDAQELGVELPDDASGEEKAGALMQAEMLGKTGDCQHESTREEVQHRDEGQVLVEVCDGCGITEQIE